MSVRWTETEIREEKRAIEQELNQLRADLRSGRCPMGAAERVSELEEQLETHEEMLEVKA